MSTQKPPLSDGNGVAPGAPLLLRERKAGPDPSLFEAVEKRFARGLERHLLALGAARADVDPQTSHTTSYDNWCQSFDPPIFWQFDVAGLRDPIELGASRALLLQLVDLFYGGTGTATPQRAEWSAAETRFAVRTGHDFARILGQAWKDRIEAAPSFSGFRSNAQNMGGTLSGKTVIQQSFQIEGVGKQAGKLCWCLSLSDVEALSESISAREAAAQPAVENDWLRQLHRSVGNIPVPVRSVLARPEISLGKILKLQVGDIIPLTMPDKVPLHVEGRQIASGTIGEANGHTAILVETVTKRFPS